MGDVVRGVVMYSRISGLSLVLLTAVALAFIHKLASASGSNVDASDETVDEESIGVEV